MIYYFQRIFVFIAMAIADNNNGQEKSKKVRVPERIKFFETMDDEFRMMDEREVLHEISSKYPEYGFDSNKG